MKDHEIREAINELRDIAIKYRDAQCLREAIAPVVHSIVRKSKPIIKKVKDLKVGDRIRILATDISEKPYGTTNLAKIVGIEEESESFCANYELHFEGTPKDNSVTLQLQYIQTEYEVL